MGSVVGESEHAYCSTSPGLITSLYKSMSYHVQYLMSPCFLKFSFLFGYFKLSLVFLFRLLFYNSQYSKFCDYLQMFYVFNTVCISIKTKQGCMKNYKSNDQD